VELSFAIAFGAVGVLQLGGLVLTLRQQRHLSRLNSRLSNVVSGVSLLTDTTETGLRDVATEISRGARPAAARPRPRAATQRRMASAARLGRSIQDIAADEQVSEGEVKLRLQLAAGPEPRRPRAEPNAATL
jgi:hypothetical protein